LPLRPAAGTLPMALGLMLVGFVFRAIRISGLPAGDSDNASHL
jgi:hypothetical protein